MRRPITKLGETLGRGGGRTVIPPLICTLKSRGFLLQDRQNLTLAKFRTLHRRNLLAFQSIKKILLLNAPVFWEDYRTFGIYAPDRLFHTWIVGQTGVVKSHLMRHMMMQDLMCGRGFCLFDPHGDLAEELRPFLGNNAIYLDIANPNNQYGFNPLYGIAPKYRPLVASNLIESLKQQWADAWGVRMEHLLRNALLALLSKYIMRHERRFRVHVKAKVAVIRRIDETLTIYHGPRKLADYDANGQQSLSKKAVAQCPPRPFATMEPGFGLRPCRFSSWQSKRTIDLL